MTFLSRQRARAYTAPGTRTKNGHTHQQQSPASLSTDAARVRKRSYSAILPRNIPDEALRQLLSISRHTALLPERTDGKSGPHQKHPEPQATSSKQPHQATYVTTEAEFMKIEMKGLRKNSSTEISGSRHKVKANDTHLPQVSKLPPIPDPPVEREETTTTLTITVTKSVTGRKQNSEHIVPSEPDSIMSAAHPSTGASSGASNVGVAPSGLSHLSIVSIGDAKPVVGKMIMPRIGHHSSGKGRLSQGWLPPQPIQPLKGSPIHRRVGGACITEEVSEVKSRLSPTASMMIDVNVN